MPKPAKLGPPGWASAKRRKEDPKAREGFNKRHREYRKMHRERYRAYLAKWNKTPRGRRLKRIWHLRRYNVTPEQYEEKWKKQGKKCGVCGTRRPKRFKGRGNGWHLDHDHETGEFRGILCTCCNLGIGFFEDDPDILKKAIKYLKRRKVTSPCVYTSPASSRTRRRSAKPTLPSRPMGTRSPTTGRGKMRASTTVTS